LVFSPVDTEKEMKIYDVGGYVRDSLMGISSKDRDFVVVSDFFVIDQAWNQMKQYLDDEEAKIFLETPECYTIRANHPRFGPVDFVLARHEIGYESDSRKPIVVPGSLWQDLQRRDFTVNAIARDVEGNIIDPFGGQRDIKYGLLRCPKDPILTMLDDPLRALRALRFSVKLGFAIHESLWTAIESEKVLEKTKQVVSPERIADELSKAFAFDTWKTWKILQRFPEALVKYWLTAGNAHLQPTFKALK
jgi:poly(A) polymerase